MIWDIIQWTTLIYLGIVILFQLGLTFEIIKDNYSESGIKSAIIAGLGGIMMNVWYLVKVAIGVLICSVIIHSCFGKDYFGFYKSELKSEMNIIVNFVSNHNLSSTTEYSKDLRMFSKTIKDYDDSEINYLKGFTKLYMAYVQELDKAFNNSLKKYIISNKFVFERTKHLTELRKKLENYDFKLKSSLVKIENNTSQDFTTLLNTLPETQKVLLLNESIANQKAIKGNLSLLYNSIFNEKNEK